MTRSDRKKRTRRIPFFVAIVSAASIACGRRAQEAMVPGEAGAVMIRPAEPAPIAKSIGPRRGGTGTEEISLITRTDAIRVAREEIGRTRIGLQKGAPVTVDLVDGIYIVTFKRVNPPGVRGPDFDARISIRADTGKVTKIEVGA